MFFLAEFKDTESFEKIMRLAVLPSDILEELIGDLITEELSNILYLTFNGNTGILKDAVRNEELSVLVRSAMMSVLGQLYLDGRLDQQFCRLQISADSLRCWAIFEQERKGGDRKEIGRDRESRRQDLSGRLL